MKNLDIKSLPAQLRKLVLSARKYVIFVFILAFIAIYGFLGYRINTLSNVKPEGDPAAQITRKLKVDPELVSKIQQLQDNSVSVQTLFNEARSNPFQE